MTRIVDIFDSYLNMSAKDKDQVTQYFSGINTDALTLRKQSSSVGSGAGYSDGNVAISFADGVTLYNPSTGARTIYLDPDGDAWFGNDTDDPAKTALSIFSNAQKYNSEDLGEGDLLVGDNSSGKGNMWWDNSTGKLYFRSGTTNSVEIGAGGIVATWGNIGGWSIDATRIYKTGIILDSANDKITVGASAPNLILDGANKVIKSSNFSDDAAGFQLSAVSGDAEFNNIVARGSFRSSVFTYENILAIGGHLVVSKSAAEVNTDVTTAATFTLVVKADDSGGALVASGDILEIKGWNGTALIDVYVTAGAVTTAGGTCSFTATLNSGGTGVALQRGMGVVNLGPSGSGLIKLQAGDLGDATVPTRLSIQTHAGAPWTTLATKAVLGDMYNTYGTGANHRYGLGIGDYAGGNYLAYNAEVADQFVLKAGSGAVALDGSGMRITMGTDVANKVVWVDDSDVYQASVYTWVNGSDQIMKMHNAPSGATRLATIEISAHTEATYPANVELLARSNPGGTAASIDLLSDSNAAIPNIISYYADKHAFYKPGGTGWVYSDGYFQGALGLQAGVTAVPSGGEINAQGNITTLLGMSIGNSSPPLTIPRGTLFLDYTGNNSYGFITSVLGNYRASNQYYDGTWRAIENAASAQVAVSATSGWWVSIAPSVAAGAAVANDKKFQVDASGNAIAFGTGVFRGNTTPPAGVGIELAWLSTYARVLAYNRTTAVRVPMYLDASEIQLRLSGTSYLTVATNGDVYTVPWTPYNGATVGWSSFTVKQMYYKVIGKTCYIAMNMDGTSNAAGTYKQVTLPYTAENNAGMVYEGPTNVYQGGAFDVHAGYWQVLANTNYVRFYRNSGAAWTASGRTIARIEFFYQVA